MRGSVVEILSGWNFSLTRTKALKFHFSLIWTLKNMVKISKVIRSLSFMRIISIILILNIHLWINNTSSIKYTYYLIDCGTDLGRSRSALFGSFRLEIRLSVQNEYPITFIRKVTFSFSYRIETRWLNLKYFLRIEMCNKNQKEKVALNFNKQKRRIKLKQLA